MLVCYYHQCIESRKLQNTKLISLCLFISQSQLRNQNVEIKTIHQTKNVNMECLNLLNQNKLNVNNNIIL